MPRKVRHVITQAKKKCPESKLFEKKGSNISNTCENMQHSQKIGISISFTEDGHHKLQKHKTNTILYLIKIDRHTVKFAAF